MKIEIYKIYNPKTDQFASNYGWTKAGKAWGTLANVKIHLRSKLWNILPSAYESKDIKRIAEIVARGKIDGWRYKGCKLIKITELGVTETPVLDILKTMECKDQPYTVYDRLVDLYGPDWLGG